MATAASATNQAISKIQASAVAKSKNSQPPRSNTIANSSSKTSYETPTTAEACPQQDRMVVLPDDSPSNGIPILGMEHQQCQAVIDTIFGTTLPPNYHHHDHLWSKRKLPTTVSPPEQATPELEAPLLGGGAGIKEQ